MHRIDTITAQKDKFGAGKNGFTLGNAQTGVPPTEVSADILDAMQEEICAVIEDSDSGQSLSKRENNQLLTSIKNIFRSAGMSATEMLRGSIKLATQLQTDSGSDDVAVTPKKLKYGFAINLSQNGYIVLPSWMMGIIIQWGNTTTTPIDSAIKKSYPIAFPNNCLIGVSSYDFYGVTGSTPLPAIGFHKISKTEYIISSPLYNNAQPGANWIAIGN